MFVHTILFSKLLKKVALFYFLQPMFLIKNWGFSYLYKTFYKKVFKLFDKYNSKACKLYPIASDYTKMLIKGFVPLKFL